MYGGFMKTQKNKKIDLIYFILKLSVVIIFVNILLNQLSKIQFFKNSEENKIIITSFINNPNSLYMLALNSEKKRKYY